ncbi:unnamed protein product [Symbiodinium sp. CCMP2592]|nr:unnamed protein product [Symbiodinium sp. CCMP2592]
MERFLHRRWDGRIVDVDEFQVAKALLDGETDLLSQEIDSEEHLFVLCCRFGHESTAAAMISYRVPGCVFKGPHSLRRPAVEPHEPQAGFVGVCWSRKCRDWSCRCCSWGFPEDAGVWMEDWDASLQNAKSAAESASATPVVRALLEAFRSQVACEGIATEDATAYLLDVAILVGDAELARSCAQHCTRFPLRRWRLDEFVVVPECHPHYYGFRIIKDGPCLQAEILEKDILIAALAAGLELEQLTHGNPDPVSLAEAVVLSADEELWQRIEGLQLRLGPGPMHEDGNDMARYLLEHSGGFLGLSPKLLHRAKRAGLALSSFQMKVDFNCECGGCAFGRPGFCFSLLDLAILFGQSDCSRLCGAMDIAATKLTMRASLEAMPVVWEDLDPCEDCGCSSWYLEECLWENFSFSADSIASLPERQAAAAEALRTALPVSLRRTASSAGFGLFQAMRKWAQGKHVPVTLVNLVLTFAAGRPALAQVWEGHGEQLPPLGHWWEETVPRESQDPKSLQSVLEVTEPHGQNESGGVTEGPPASSSNEAHAHADGTSEKASGPDQDTTNDLLTALRNSKSDNPPLSGDGVVIFRITRRAHAEEVNAVLFDATGPLWPLHRRVLEAGCEVAPEWSPIKALFVPLTHPQLQELSQGSIYELGKANLLALQSDAELLIEAFSELQRKVRPRLRREAPRVDEEDDGAADDEPFLVVEGGIRTDSSVLYPVWAGEA